MKKYHVEKVDFLQIDAEGADYDIIKSIDFNHVKPKVINYEQTLLQENKARCRSFLTKHNYNLYEHFDDTLCLSKSDFGYLNILKSDIGYFIIKIKLVKGIDSVNEQVNR